MSDANENATPQEPEPQATPNAPQIPNAPQTPSAPQTPGKASLGSMHPFDLGIVIAAGVALIASLLPFYTISVNIIGLKQSDSFNAWNDIIGRGFFGWLGIIAAVLGGVALVAPLLGATLPVPRRLASLGLFAASVVLLLLAFFVTPVDCDKDALIGCEAINPGHGFGFYLALLAAITGTALAAIRRGED